MVKLIHFEKNYVEFETRFKYQFFIFLCKEEYTVIDFKDKFDCEISDVSDVNDASTEGKAEWDKRLKEYTEYPEDLFLDLWERIIRFIKLNVEFQDPRQYDVVTAWVFANWIPEVWQTYPYLYFFGVSGTGKNRAWETLEKISYNSSSSANISVSALFHSIRPPIIEECVTSKGRTKKKVVGYDYSTVFLDEVKPLTNKSSSDEHELHRTLNCGYKRGGVVKRCSKDTSGNFVVESFQVEGFKSIASVFSIPNALQSRCIMIQMVRSKRRFPMRFDLGEARLIKYMLGEWRDYTLKFMPQDSMFDEMFTERRLFKLAEGDGRLVELYYPLYRVAPISCKYVIEDYLESEGKDKIELTLDSSECEVFEALLSVLDNTPDANWVRTKDVVNQYNNTHELNTQTDAKRIYNKLRELGLKPLRTSNARGFAVNLKIIEKLKERYRVKQNTQSILFTSPTDVIDVTDVT